MIASRPENSGAAAEEALFPDVPTHVPVLQAQQTEQAQLQEHSNGDQPQTQTQQQQQPQQQQQRRRSSGLPPIPPVEIPTNTGCQLAPQEPMRSSPSVAPAPQVLTPPPDYRILYSQQPQQHQQQQQPVQQPQPEPVIEAYPVLPDEQHFSYAPGHAGAHMGAATVVQAQPYQASGTSTPATTTTAATTASSTPAPSVAPAARRSSRPQDEETKEYNPGPAPTLSQTLRGIFHEIGDVIMEATDGTASRSSRSPRSTAARNESRGHGQIARRVLMPHRVQPNTAGRFDVYVTMYQPQLQGAWSTPQGSRPRELLITTYPNEREAVIAGLAHAPPRWEGPGERNSCVICNKSFTFVRRPHHCRNCGYYVCSSCSHKHWPSSMVPPTYHNAEKRVRACNACHFLMETFRDALKHGDYELARQTYESGNVNLHCPNEMERGEYPVHFAAQGGNLMIMRWLVEEQMCALRDPIQPLMTADKLSVLAVAASYGQTAIMHYLMHEHGCKVTEITDVSILQRALHMIIDAPGDPPPFPRNRISKKRRNSTRRIATIGNSDFGRGSTSSSAVG